VPAQHDGEHQDRQQEQRRAGPDRGQSSPPSPMMVGMNGGAVCAWPEVSRTEKAYSFQAKIRQKMAVAAIPVAACGRTTFTKACRRE
jgi:hypothetical protein